MRSFASKIAVLLGVILVGIAYPWPWPGSPSTSAEAGPREVESATPAPVSDATAWTQPTPTVVASPSATPTPIAMNTGRATATPGTKSEESVGRSRQPSVGLPRRIVIPAIDVDAAFEFVGLARDGAMGVPKDPNKVAWYQLGPRPGEPGNAVVAGHVDWGTKTAVFWRLGQLKVGDEVEVIAADQRKYRFAVRSLQWFEADRAPVAEVFQQTREAEITLITCGGTFDRGTRQYLSRLVVKGALR